MSGIRYAQLGSICDRITDGSHNPPAGCNESDYLMLSSKNVYDDRITFDDPRYLSKDQFELENRRTQIAPGDILLTIVGTIGRVAVVPRNAGNITFQRSVAVLRPNKKTVYNRYLMYAIRKSRPTLENEARGVAQKGIYLNQVKEIPIPLPSIEKQQEIAVALDAVSEVLRLRKAQLAELDTLVKSQFVEMFGSDSFSSVSLADCCLGVTGGGTPSMQHPEYYGGDVPFIKSGDVKSNAVSSGALWLTQKALEETPAKYVPKGSVLVVNRSAALLREFRAAIASNPVVINQDIKAFIPKPEYTSRYLLWAIKIQTQYLLTKVTTVLTSHIDVKDLLTLPIAAASIERQEAFTAFMDSIDKSKFSIQQALDETQRLFDSLMAEYFE